MRFEEELVELLPRLRRFARGLTRHQSDADDLCHAAIERALHARDHWPSGTKLDTWRYRISLTPWMHARPPALPPGQAATPSYPETETLGGRFATSGAGGAA